MRSRGAKWIAAALAALFLSASVSAAGGTDDQLAAMPRLKADRLVVIKSARQLLLMHDGYAMRVYRIALGRYPTGRKIREGDARTPEGTYTIDDKVADSDFYKAIHISYPNFDDLARADALGVDPGGQIMIHGLPNRMSAERVGHPLIDWTLGCIAVSNREMDEIWRLVDVGTPIEIHP